MFTVASIIAGFPLARKQPVGAKIQVAKSPFAIADERAAYQGREVTNRAQQLDLILKQYTFPAADFGYYEDAIGRQTIAACLAKKFNAEMRGSAFKLKFPEALLFYTSESLFVAYRCRSPANCKFLRFSTTNMNDTMLEQRAEENGVDESFVRQLMAFSHWTYQVTEGYLIVVDLEGIVYSEQRGIELADPTIHCRDLQRFGRANLGADGIDLFFGQHKCNEFCRRMNLANNRGRASLV